MLVRALLVGPLNVRTQNTSITEYLEVSVGEAKCIVVHFPEVAQGVLIILFDANSKFISL